MKRLDYLNARCEVCDAPLRRKRDASGRLSKPRRTCGKQRCAKILAHRTRAAAAAMLRKTELVRLAEIAEENRLRVERCSRCGDAFVCTTAISIRYDAKIDAMVVTERVANNRQRCDYCARNNGTSKVAYKRGPNRGRDEKYERELAAIYAKRAAQMEESTQ